MSKKLVLLRHGQSSWNKQNRFTGWIDVDLTDEGKNEAINAGKELKKNGYEFDLGFTSFLKRSINTFNYCLKYNQSSKIEVISDWRLNERHYGALQGLNKIETVKKFGEDQVFKWRRSYATCPPKLPIQDESHPINDLKYSNIKKSDLPSSESLKDVKERFMPLWNEIILKEIENGKKIIIVAHGNSLRALIKHLNKKNNEDISALNIPTGIPMVFEFGDNLEPIKNYYLGNSDEIKKKINDVSNQSIINKDN